MPYKSKWSIPIPDCSLPSFLFGSAKHVEDPDLANKAAYLDATNPSHCAFTRAEVKLWGQRLGLGLSRTQHFQYGDRIQIFSSNSMAIPIAFFGVLMAGGIFTAANPAFVARELATQLNDSGAKYLLVAEDALDTALEAASTAGLPVERIRYMDPDFLFHNTTKASIKGVQYWSDLFVMQDEAANYQWPELKGTCPSLGSCVSI